MAKLFTFSELFVYLSLFVSCSSQTKHPGTVKENQRVVGGEQVVKNTYGVIGEDIIIRATPEDNGKKLVNEKATRTLGGTHYCQVDSSTMVVVLETKDEWSKIQVVRPEWLSETHVGWIPSKNLVSSRDEEKQLYGNLDPKEFEIIKVSHKPVVQNFHVLVKYVNFDKKYVYQFIKKFRAEHCTRNCNVLVYDSKSILPLIEVYPLNGEDYIKLADHLVSMSTFDATEIRDWYPYQDTKYKEYGGRNWRKEPIK